MPPLSSLFVRGAARVGGEQRSRGGGLLLVAVLALALAGCTLPAAAASPTATPVASVPNDVPLPQNSTFATTGHTTQVGGRAWVYTVANTDARQLEAFYHTTLPTQGWNAYQAAFGTSGSEAVTITAQKVGRALTITIGPGPVGSVAASPGGVVLQLAMSPTGI